MFTKSAKINKLAIADKAYTSKIFLFSNTLKKWKNVVFLDNDIIVNGSIEKLKNVNGFFAASELDDQKLSYQYDTRHTNFRKAFLQVEDIIKNKIDLKSSSFNAGVLAFSTNIISSHTFNNLRKLQQKYYYLCNYLDQSILNLYFYKKWKKLPRVYNFHPLYYSNQYRVPKKQLNAIIFHFAGHNKGDKPWEKTNEYYRLWHKYFEKSNNIGKRGISLHIKTWHILKIVYYELYYRLKKLLTKYNINSWV